MKKYLLPAVSMLLLVAYVVFPRTQHGADASAEEYAVYSAVIADMLDGERVAFHTQAKLLVIQNQTGTDRTSNFDSEKNEQYAREMFPTMMEGVMKNYRAQNSSPIRLQDSFDLKVKHVLVEKQVVEKAFGNGWEEFYKRYPDSGGLIILSRVGFNAGMTQALVYIQQGCGALCGSGSYVLLEKRTDGWRVITKTVAWIA